MDDLSRTIAELREQLTPAWNDAHADRLLAGIGRSRKRRRFHRFVGSAALGAAFVGTVVVVRHNPREIGDACGFVIRVADAAFKELNAQAKAEATDGLQLTAAELRPLESAPIVVTQVSTLQPVRLDALALMEAADAARSNGQPKLAVEYLRRVLRDHRASQVAPLAGFTLGHVLLESLGQPSEAAEAFAAVRNIAPRGSLAEDALAREVEALSKAGHSREAYDRAQLYAQAYPAGRKLRSVRLFGGLPN